MTRQPSYGELDGYQQAIKGQTPLQVEVMQGSPIGPEPVSPLVLIVNRGNPLTSMSLKDIRKVLAARRSSELRLAPTLRDLGVGGPQGSRVLHLYGFDTEGENSAAFAAIALGAGGRWSCVCDAPPSRTGTSMRISDVVRSDVDALGLTTLSAITPGVKVIGVGEDRSRAVKPTPESLASGRYLFGRTVIAVARRSAVPGVKDLLAFLLSAEGQAIVQSDPAFVPLSVTRLAVARKALQ
jgi:phosphate transport system substrate-binding protein